MVEKLLAAAGGTDERCQDLLQWRDVRSQPCRSVSHAGLVLKGKSNSCKGACSVGSVQETGQLLAELTNRVDVQGWHTACKRSCLLFRLPSSSLRVGQSAARPFASLPKENPDQPSLAKPRSQDLLFAPVFVGSAASRFLCRPSASAFRALLCLGA